MFTDVYFNKHLQRQQAGMLPPPPTATDDEVAEEEWVVPSRFRRYKNELRMMMTKQYWIDLFFNHEGEVLVDTEVLLWSYLEAGVIECAGALTTFFAVLYVGFGIDPATAASAQSAGGFFMPHSPNLTLADGSILV